MSTDVRNSSASPAGSPTVATPAIDSPRRPAAAPLSDDSKLAVEIRGLVERGELEDARQRFEGLVVAHQRRALRIAFQYLRDSAEADEAVQDAFVKAYTHIGSFQPTLSFEVWFTRILINGCLDRQKARTRRSRWMMPVSDMADRDQDTIARASRPGERSPEDLLIASEWRERLTAAVKRLPGRQRLVFLLCHYADHSTRDVAEMIGLNESTVRVHLFRAVRKLRTAMEGQHHAR